jgi:hypothetical protein
MPPWRTVSLPPAASTLRTSPVTGGDCAWVDRAAASIAMQTIDFIDVPLLA